MQTKLFKTAEINGESIDFEITVTIEEDDTSPEGDFDFGDSKENAEYLARFHSGDLFMAVIHVKAEAFGMEGTDVLGSCHLISSNAQANAMETVEEYSMISNAIDECVQNIESTASRLKRFAK